MKRICVSLGYPNLQNSLEEARKLATVADVIEVRLDLLDEIIIAPFLAAIQTPLLFTNRPEWEGGRYHGEEEHRLAPLLEAAENEVSYIDLELRAPKSSWSTLLEVCSGTSTRIISSWHDFQATPSSADLAVTLQKMQDSGAHIGKIVTTAHTGRDALRTLNLLDTAAEIDFPLIAFAMGEHGKISRAASPALGGYMTYCATDHGAQTAPGQIKIGDIKDIYRILGDG